jgi:hypothetical protein
MIRAVARITISRGNGRGVALGIIRLRSAEGSEDDLRASLRDALDPRSLDGVISMHLIESDPALSGPTKEISSATAGSGDWFVLIDATDVNAASAAMLARFAHSDSFKSPAISTGIYRLMWDLSKSDIPV